MSEVMRPIPFEKLMEWALGEYRGQGSVFGIRSGKFYKNMSGNGIDLFGDRLASPVGPAAGPNAQLAQNIVAAYLAGSRFIELKTVQKLDGEALAKCVARPCINAEDEGYNVEWSTELTVPQAFDEYLKAWFAIHVLAKELDISDRRDFAYNMSVGYDLEGIKSPKIDAYIEGMKDASQTEIWRECTGWLAGNLSRLTRFERGDLEAVSPRVCASITLSTLHGCPPEEIERIAKYLLDEKKVHTYVKCNPTLLGYEFARSLLDEMGYSYVSFDDHHFKNDLQYTDAVAMLRRLMTFAIERGLSFGVKLTNTFPVKIERGELPGEEMYMSGRALYPLSLSVAARLARDFDGRLPISYSGGADAFNIEALFQTGIRPITVATTILKPGGYERIGQLADLLEPLMADAGGIDKAAVLSLAERVAKSPNHRKEKREGGTRKTDVPLGLFDCYQASCKEGGCPIGQQIPEYLEKVAVGDLEGAFEIIAVDNAAPSITGTICNHVCQQKCTRVDYDESLQIRRAKLTAADAEQDGYIERIELAPLRTDKRAVVIGAGPGGVAAALYLRRNGVAVTVLEKRDRPFGIVEHVIPAFRIPPAAIERDLRMAEKTGVAFVLNAGEDHDVARLKEDYGFVILATGAWKEGAPPLKEGAGYTRDALEFLMASKTADCKLPLGGRVAVIGGGDVAMDCARAAKRAPDTKEVTIVYRRTEDFMPAEPEEIRLAKEDGVLLRELLGPVSYEDGRLLCEKMALGNWDESGRRGVLGTGETLELAFDTVINAVGARVDTGLFEKNGIALDGRGRAILGPAGESSVADVYVIGDGKAGPSTIVSAMADAKRAAKDILDKLGLSGDFIKMPVPREPDDLYGKKGVLQAAGVGGTDASRCLACDQLCEICCDVCPNRANVHVAVPGMKNRHQILHIDAMCNECGNCGVFCPHAGNPYKDKFTYFSNKEDFLSSKNRGFLKLEGTRYEFRLEDGALTEVSSGDPSVPAEMWAMVRAAEERCPYYLV